MRKRKIHKTRCTIFFFVYHIWGIMCSLFWGKGVQGGEDSWDALSCRSFFAKEPVFIGLFCRKCTIKIRHDGSSPPCTLRGRQNKNTGRRHKEGNKWLLTGIWAQTIAFGVSSILNLQSESHGSLLTGTWQKRPRERDQRLRFETEEMTLHSQ